MPDQSPPLESLTIEGILKTLRDADARFFCDQYGNVCASLPWDSHRECLQIRSRKFRQRLRGLIQQKSNVRMGAALLKAVVQELELLAEEGAPVRLENRVAAANGNVFLDLGDETWQVIQVTREGYKIVQVEAPCFGRALHQRPLPKPIDGSQPSLILKHLGLPDNEEGLLLWAWFVAALHPNTPAPILAFIGGQGSAKSTRCERVRSLLDPSIVPLLGDVEMRDLMQVFQHHAVPVFDNVGRFSRKIADVFCRAVTGSGTERRRLYTDSDEVIFAFRRPIIINGTDVPSDRPDFRDRCLVITVGRLDKFHTRASGDAEFEQARPGLFGAILDLLVKTLGLLESTPSTGEFRLADFAHFGRAVARALGKTAEDFDRAYRANLGEHNRDLVEDSPFARALRAFSEAFTEKDPWKGSAGALLAAAAKAAKEKSIPRNDASWPKSPRWVSPKLRELAPCLRADNVVVQQLPRQNDLRPWRVYSVKDQNRTGPDTESTARSSDPPSQPLPQQSADTATLDSSSPSLSPAAVLPPLSSIAAPATAASSLPVSTVATAHATNPLAGTDIVAPPQAKDQHA